MVGVELRRREIKNCCRPRHRVSGNEEKGKHVMRTSGIEQTSKLLRRYRSALRFACPLCLGCQRAEDMRNVAHLLPLARAIERRAPYRQNAIDPALPCSSAGKPLAKPALLLGRDVRDGALCPELLPV